MGGESIIGVIPAALGEALSPNTGCLILKIIFRGNIQSQ